MTQQITEAYLIKRFWVEVEKTDGCWLWRGYVNGQGYGRFSIRWKQYQAHRIAYEWSVGAIPAGLTLDHLCSNRRCVNPAHLEPVTLKENIRRGTSYSGQRARQTACAYGHPLDGFYLVRGKPHRYCKTCDRARQRARYAAKREAMEKLGRAVG